MVSVGGLERSPVEEAKRCAMDHKNHMTHTSEMWHMRREPHMHRADQLASKGWPHFPRLASGGAPFPARARPRWSAPLSVHMTHMDHMQQMSRESVMNQKRHMAQMQQKVHVLRVGGRTHMQQMRCMSHTRHVHQVRTRGIRVMSLVSVTRVTPPI